MQIENFLAVLDRMQSFADFGEEFSGEPALKLKYLLLPTANIYMLYYSQSFPFSGMIKQLSVAYYQDFHFARMEVPFFWFVLSFFLDLIGCLAALESPVND